MTTAAVGGLAVVGDVFCDIIIRGVSHIPEPGEEVFGCEPVMCPGGVANVAVGVANLGVPTWLLARTRAEDSIGEALAKELAKRDDLTVTWLQTAPSTALTVAVPVGTERAMVSYVPPADGRALAGLIPWDGLGRVRHLHLGGWDEGHAPLDDQAAILRTARSRGITTSLDVSLQSDLERVARLRELLADVDVFLPNRAEACQLTGCDDPLEALEQLRDLVPTVVIKLGGEGAVGAANHVTERVAAPAVTVVDTTGAGDAFAAGFLFGHLRRWPLRRCMEFGTVCGSLAVGRLGSSVSAPARREAFAALEAAAVVEERTPTVSS